MRRVRGPPRLPLTQRHVFERHLPILCTKPNSSCAAEGSPKIDQVGLVFWDPSTAPQPWLSDIYVHLSYQDSELSADSMGKRYGAKSEVEMDTKNV